MYLRQTRRATRDGTVIRYLQLAHNERHPETGTPTAKVIFNFGRADDLDLDVLRRLVASITRYLDQQDVEVPSDAIPTSIASAAVEVQDLGMEWVFAQLWQRLGLAGTPLMPSGSNEEARNLELIVTRLAAGQAAPEPAVRRVIDDSRKGAITSWRETLSSGLFAASPAVAGSASFIEAGWRCEDESGREAPLEAGVSAMNPRVDREFLVLLAVGPDGVPFQSWIFPANFKRKPVVRVVEKEVLARTGSLPLWLTNSRDRAQTLAVAGGHHVIVDSSRAATSRFSAEHAAIDDQLRLATVGIEGSERLFLSCDSERARADAAERLLAIERFRGEVALVARLSKRRREQRLDELVENTTLPVRITKRGAMAIDEKAMTTQARLDGQSLIRTSDSGLSPTGAAAAYRRVLASTADVAELNQLYDDAAMITESETRSLVCLAALGLRRIVESRCARPWREVGEVLSGVRLVSFADDGATYVSHTAISQEQRQVIAALGLSELFASSRRVPEPEEEEEDV